MNQAASQTQNIPKLRFPEFSDEWQSFSLSDLFNNKGGTALEDQVVPDGSHKFISIGNYSTDGKYIDNGQRVNLNQKTREKLLNKNDLVMVLNDKTAAGDIIGSSILINEDNFVYNQRSERVIPNSKILPKYAWNVLNSRNFRKKVYLISQGGTQIYVNFPSVKKLIIIIPNINEQQKIADFLTAVDEKIAGLEKKVELLKKYKKGVMQQIFTQKIRFKEENGKFYPAWEEKRFDEVFKIGAGGDIVQDHFKKLQDKVYKYPVYSNSERDNGLYGYSDIYKEDGTCITVTGRGALGIAVARHEPFYPIVRLLTLRPKQASNIDFYENLINQKKFYIESTGVPQLTGPQISGYKIIVPCVEEQQKIAKFLNIIDEKINLTENELEQAKKFKKGLLQQMFV